MTLTVTIAPVTCGCARVVAVLRDGADELHIEREAVHGDVGAARREAFEEVRRWAAEREAERPERITPASLFRGALEMGGGA